MTTRPETTRTTDWPGRVGGFTLVELLAVIGIIALLVSILTVAVVKVRDISRRSGTLATIGTIEVGLASYKNDHGEYPISYADDYEDYQPYWVTSGGLETAYHGEWYGAEILVERMIGYLGEDSDYKEGEGFRFVRAGDVYGPYVPSDKMRIVEPRNDRRVFTDMFDNPILYYKYDQYDSSGLPDHTTSGTWEYSSIHNTGKIPGDIDSYTKTDGDYARKDYVLCSPGPDGEYEDTAGGDDCTNFLGD